MNKTEKKPMPKIRPLNESEIKATAGGYCKTIGKTCSSTPFGEVCSSHEACL